MVEITDGWLSLALSGIALAGIIYNWFTSGEKKVAEELALFKAAQGQAAAAHDRRIQAVEAELKYVPRLEQIMQLQATLHEMRVEMTKIGASADQSARTAARVETYLLEHGK